MSTTFITFQVVCLYEYLGKCYTFSSRYFNSFGENREVLFKAEPPGVSASQRQILTTTLITHKLNFEILIFRM